MTDLTALRGTALVDALEQSDASDLQREGVDLTALVKAIEPADLPDADMARLLGAVGRIAGQEPDLDFSSVDASELTRLVAAATPGQLERTMADRVVRSWLIDEIFRRMAPHVRVDRIQGMDAVVRWRITGGSGDGGFDRYELRISDGTCAVTKEMGDRPPRR